MISDFPKSCQDKFLNCENDIAFWFSENAAMLGYVDWIKRGLEKPGKSRVGLAAAMQVSPSAITQMISPSKGKPRLIKAHELPVIATYLEEDVPGSEPPETPRTVSLVGYVGAGATVNSFGEGQGPFDEVNAPEGVTDDTVAVEIRGTSLGELFDQWLVFYDEVHDPPTTAMLGKLCVVGLEDGRVLVKKLRRGQLPDHFTLLSNTEPPIYDAVVQWAAIVKQMSPR